MRPFNQPIEALRDWAPLPIRLIVGYGFMAHGFAKLTRGPDTFAVVLHTLGVPLPDLAAWVTTAVEILGGAAVFTGFLIPIASSPLAVVLLTAIFTVHLPYGFFSVKLAQVTETGTKFGPVGYEILLLYLGGLATLSLSGSGYLSLDRLLEKARLRNAHAAADSGIVPRRL